jgi:hypothetical protein
MDKTIRKNKNGSGPSVIRFEAKLTKDSKSGKNGFSALVNFPKPISKKLGGLRKAEGTINGHAFRATLESNALGNLSLRLNKAMRKGAGTGVGNVVKLAILGPQPEPRVPSDLRVGLTASGEAKILWKDLTSLGRCDWIRWIESAKTAETRARRVRRTVEQLSEGKRRPCCVNVYEFMLRHVEK